MSRPHDDRAGADWEAGTVVKLTLVVSTSEPESVGQRLAALLPEVETLVGRPWDLARQAPLAEVLVVDQAVVDSTILRLARRLRLVQLLGPGLETVDLPACGGQGVYVANLPWGRRLGYGLGRLVEAGEPPAELAASTVARVVAGNVRRLLRGQAPLFWANPPAWVDPEQALCGRSVMIRSATA